MAVVFKVLTKHDRLQFLPDQPLGFAPDVEEYFINAGFAEATDAEPAHTYSEDEVTFDPETRNSETGELVVHSAMTEANNG